MAIPLPPALGRHDRVQWFFDLRCCLKSLVQPVVIAVLALGNNPVADDRAPSATWAARRKSARPGWCWLIGWGWLGQTVWKERERQLLLGTFKARLLRPVIRHQGSCTKSPGWAFLQVKAGRNSAMSLPLGPHAQVKNCPL